MKKSMLLIFLLIIGCGEKTIEKVIIQAPLTEQASNVSNNSQYYKAQDSDPILVSYLDNGMPRLKTITTQEFDNAVSGQYQFLGRVRENLGSAIYEYYIPNIGFSYIYSIKCTPAQGNYNADDSYSCPSNSIPNDIPIAYSYGGQSPETVALFQYETSGNIGFTIDDQIIKSILNISGFRYKIIGYISKGSLEDYNKRIK